MQRIGRIAEQIALQHDKTEKQQLAMELKAKAQQLDILAMGLALSGEAQQTQYEREKEQFLALVEQVSAAAANIEQRKWRTSLRTTAGEFANQYGHILKIMQQENLTAEEKTNRLKQRYTLSQAHKSTGSRCKMSFDRREGGQVVKQEKTASNDAKC